MTATEFIAKCAALKITPINCARIMGVKILTVRRWRWGIVPVPQYVAVILDLLSRHKDPGSYQPPR